jgi:dUTP pyrophosphatase
MLLKVLPLNDQAAEFYSKHSTFHDGDSGLDLFVIEDQVVKAFSTSFIKLGFKAAAVDAEGKNVSWLIFPRSSISKTPLRLANSIGLIDAGYRGELLAAVDNIRGEDYQVKTGDRLVQAVAFNGGPISLKIVESLDATTRGEGGFGSTNEIPTVKAAKIEGEPTTAGA